MLYKDTLLHNVLFDYINNKCSILSIFNSKPNSCIFLLAGHSFA
ncbi:hypothetical protein MANES_02G211960v8 [Manihot esculenta]|uniref:Uncharacterized protein n=1 Tax=Manihot esculenta TaxID=3983 RepID=A0ACB7I7T7_MANES|nr:hypothetical protein MANES_02G211960v8 [Manihot esculenta]